MKPLSAGLTFVNVATVFALLLGILGHGLGPTVAAVAILLGAIAACFAFAATRDPEHEAARADAAPTSDTPRRWNRLWFYLVVGCFAFLAFRGFCWLLFIDGNQLKVQSPNNLGDLALHLTYINNFASGVPLWPENPIHYHSFLRYPAGTDLFNAVLVRLGFDLTRGLIWAGLLGSLATFYALYRWSGVFGVAAFLFNGGVAGFQILQTWQFRDYQSAKTIAWKSLPLTMFLTQRGLLYALPAGLLLLYHWRAKYFPRDRGETSTADRTGPLPFWLEIALYASMPLFHVHTFMALSIVAAFFFIVGDRDARKRLGTMAGVAFVPATFLVWTITDHFQARSMLAWHPGWVQNADDFAAPFFLFWFANFGLFVPLGLLLLGLWIWRAVKSETRFSFRDYPSLALLVPATLIFLFACLVKTAPWEWDNIKLIIWAYLIALPFFWTDLIARWPLPARVAVCLALFFSGFVCLFGGLVGGENGYAIGERSEIDAVAGAVRKLPVEARFAAFPTYNHPLLLNGRRVVLGYPGHLWTQGFDYAATEKKLESVMIGGAKWKENARELGARYLFWGREEKAKYTVSTRPWEREAHQVATGPWGAIYDLEAPPVPQMPAP